MEHTVSKKVNDRLNDLMAGEKTKKAMDFVFSDSENMIDTQCELALIPAPTFQEEKKAQRILEIFKENGLKDAHIDEYGNVVGVRKGTGGGKTVLLEGHMDTVFPMDTKLEIIRKDGWIHCPGIVDDTRGCVSVIGALRAMNDAGIQTKGDIHFVTTVQEEGAGALNGMKYYVTHHPELDASISIDGDGFSEITYEATGIQTYEVTFHGIGGHAYGMFGKVANPIHAAGRAIAKIADFVVPEFPKTTFAVTNLEAGSVESVHAIVKDATIRFNFRSNGQKELMDLKKAIFDAIDEACKEESEKWGKDTITYTTKHLMDVNAGTQDAHSPIVEASMAIAKVLGAEEAKLGHGGSTNCNRALEVGLPAVCLGGGSGYDPKCHTLEECFRIEGAYKGTQQAMLLALLCAGSEYADSIVD
jgi:tripeptide aminopeptidase